MRRVLSGILAVALAATLSACIADGASPTESDATPNAGVSGEAKVDIPAGFTSGGYGLATKWTTPDTCAGQGSGCVLVEVFAYMDCSEGAYVEGTAVDADLAVVGSARGTFESLPIGETDRIELVFDAAAASATRVNQTAARCL